MTMKDDIYLLLLLPAVYFVVWDIGEVNSKTKTMKDDIYLLLLNPAVYFVL
jgi:hypothetical protein